MPDDETRPAIDRGIIRPETAADIPAIRSLIEAAFGRPGEADLTDALRENGRLELSMVYESATPSGSNAIISYVGVSPMTGAEGVGGEYHAWLRGGSVTFLIGALGPVATLPEFQGRGYASELVRAALDACRTRRGYSLVFLLGNPRFYSRFGFQRASDLNLFWERPGAEEHFQVYELRPGALAKLTSGPYAVRFAPEFDAV